MNRTLGETLSSARRALGASMADAEQATRVLGKHLEALERGEYDTLPNTAYVRGYIISYAKFLGLDPAPLLELYREEAGTVALEPLRAREQVVASRDHAHAVPRRTGLAIVAAIALVALAIWGIGRLVRGPETTPPIPNLAEETTTPEPSEQSPPGESDADAPTEPAVETTGTTVTGTPFTVKVDIAAGGASWLRVIVDGLKAYEGTLKGGEEREWEVTDEVSIRIGKPTAVTVYRDGTLVEEIPEGEIPTLTLTADQP
ncbi:MAG: helix-turn-helix domain-containing protein [Actinomycetota bacterium]|nr:helix-turn-helix domain-containing protein [Actinomycetota bacterium]